MITAVNTKLRFNEDPRWWKIALMDFVDEMFDTMETEIDPALLDCSVERLVGV